MLTWRVVGMVASMGRTGDVVYYASCSCCQRWFGLNRAHCAGCHCTFDDVDLYDAHRVTLVCKAPRGMGLVQNTHGVWMRSRTYSPELSKLIYTRVGVSREYLTSVDLDCDAR